MSVDILGNELGYAKKFMERYPKDRFFNLKRVEDGSTIYHDEFNGHDGDDISYWCEPPFGFRVNCDLLLVVITNNTGLLIAVEQGDESKYTIIKKRKNSLPEVLVDHGYEYDVQYTSDEIANAISLIN